MTDQQNRDRTFMRQAISLARRGVHTVHPNPPVGAILVRDGRVIGRGWHRHAGGNHAEIEAMKNAAEDPRGATLYVTLEPCNHVGRTGRCVDAVLAAGIGRVVIGLCDPNPNVEGGGAARLSAAGIDVVSSCLEEEVRELKEGWLKWIQTGEPFRVGLLFRSLDGRLGDPGADPIVLAWRDRVMKRFRSNEPDAQSLLFDDPAAISRFLGSRALDRLLVVQTATSSSIELFPGLGESAAQKLFMRLSRCRRLGGASLADYRIEYLP